MEDFLRELRSELADEAANLSTEDLGRQMNIVGGPKEAALPRNVGLLFFNDDPRSFFPVTQIDVVYFPESAGGDQFEEKIFVGPLARITRDAISFIERNYLKETVIKHADRSEAERLWNFPLAATPEAVVNAVYHRSYEIREPIELRISKEDLAVLSFPGPDRSIKMDDLRAGRAVSRRYRNRRIGEFLKELDLTEGRSTGITKILRVMAANGSPVPEFVTDDERSSFLIRLPIHERAAVARAEAHDQAHEPLKDLERRLLELCSGQPQTTAQLLEGLGYKTRTGNFKRVLARMLEIDCLEWTIPDRPRSKNQRYRLTDTGQRKLDRQEQP